MSSEKISITNRIWQVCEYKRLNIFLLLALFVFTFLFPIFHVSDPDIWYHLKTGEIIWQNKEIPKKDIFSYTCEGKEWVNPEWFYQVLAYPLYYLGDFVFSHHPKKSFAFLIIFQGVLLSIITFFLVSSILQRGISISVALISIFLVLFASEERFRLRVEIYSFFFIALYLWIFDKFKQKEPVLNPFASLRINSVKGANIIFVLPFLQWLWSLMHGGFVMGFLLIALFLVSELIAKAVYSVRCSVFGVRNSQFAIRNYIAPPISNSHLKKLALVFLLALVLPLLNPFFYKTYLLPFQMQFGEGFKIMRAYVMEWLPIGNPAVSRLRIYSYFYIPIAILSLTGFVLQKEKRNIFYYLLFFFVLPMPYINMRHIGIFAVSSTIPIALGIQSIFQRLAPLFKKDGQMKRAGFFVSIIVLLLSIWLIGARTRRPAFGIDVDETWLPAKACEFLKQTDIKGPMFNIMGWGGYLIWKVYPKYKTFSDGRNVMQGNEMLGEYIAVENAKPEWEKTLAQYNVHFIITFLLSAKSLLSALDANPNWSLIYFDDVSAIFLRKTPANLNLIKRYGYKAVKLSGQNFSGIKDTSDIAIAEFKQKIKEDPSCIIAHTFLAALWERKGEMGKAGEEYRIASENAKNNADTLVNLASFYLRYGKVHLASASAQKAFKKATYLHSAAVHSILGECYLAKEETKKARSYFQKALNSNPDNPLLLTMLHINIGLCYAKEGNLEKAKEKFSSAVHLNPSYLPARLNLAKCYKLQGNLDAAVAEIQECLKLAPDSAESLYALASLNALQGKPSSAIKLLKKCIKFSGKIYAEQAAQDPDFVSLHENKEFRSLIEIPQNSTLLKGENL